MHVKIKIRLVCIALFVHMILKSSCCSGWIFNTAFIKICTPPKKKLPNHVPTGQLDSEYICSFDCTISFTCMSCIIALRFDILMVSMNYRLAVPAHRVKITEPSSVKPLAHGQLLFHGLPICPGHCVAEKSHCAGCVCVSCRGGSHKIYKFEASCRQKSQTHLGTVSRAGTVHGQRAI